MSSFQAVNTSLAPEPYGRTGEETTPTTPRPNTAPNIQPQPLTRADDATTPTRATFGALASQRPLPASPFPATLSVPETADTEKKTLARGDSQYSAKSRELEDVDMEESDEGEEGSEDGSVNADGTRSAKKKKSQRFWCTDYPPCNLSFTRSEHLARHIRQVLN
jgi:C2H2 transcription facotor